MRAARSLTVSRIRSYAEVASAACDDAIALLVSSLCSRNSVGTGGLLPVVTAWTIRGRTRVGLRVPRGGGAPKVGFPVRPKICVLSQRWRQG